MRNMGARKVAIAARAVVVFGDPGPSRSQAVLGTFLGGHLQYRIGVYRRCDLPAQGSRTTTRSCIRSTARHQSSDSLPAQAQTALEYIRLTSALSASHYEHSHHTVDHLGRG